MRVEIGSSSYFTQRDAPHMSNVLNDEVIGNWPSLHRSLSSLVSLRLDNRAFISSDLRYSSCDSQDERLSNELLGWEGRRWRVHERIIGESWRFLKFRSSWLYRPREIECGFMQFINIDRRLSRLVWKFSEPEWIRKRDGRSGSLTSAKVVSSSKLSRSSAKDVLPKKLFEHQIEWFKLNDTQQWQPEDCSLRYFIYSLRL